MYEQVPERSVRPTLRPILFAVLASFVLGASATGYLAWKGYLGSAEESVTTEPRTAPLAVSSLPQPAPSASQTAAAAAVERVEETQGGIDQRLAAAEQRIARLDLQAQAAAGNAARAEGLLIAFATRRAIERGAPLGYLGDQLRLRFGDSQPNSVQTVIDFAGNPVTLDSLVTRLHAIGPQIVAGSGRPTLSRLTSELSSLFVIRRERTPSPQAPRRLERARLFLESGRVDKAIGEVERLPGAKDAAAWLADARRYERARDALDLIETTAVREPRLLRNGAGQAVEQLSPTEASPTT